MAHAVANAVRLDMQQTRVSRRRRRRGPECRTSDDRIASHCTVRHFCDLDFECACMHARGCRVKKDHRARGLLLVLCLLCYVCVWWASAIALLSRSHCQSVVQFATPREQQVQQTDSKSETCLADISHLFIECGKCTHRFVARRESQARCCCCCCLSACLCCHCDAGRHTTDKSMAQLHRKSHKGPSELECDRSVCLT